MLVMFSYGSKKKLKIESKVGDVICPNCGHYVEMVLAREKGYYTFCDIPVIPYSGWRIKLCPVCGIVEKYDKTTYEELKKEYPAIEVKENEEKKNCFYNRPGTVNGVRTSKN